jgi:2-iminobutanoate/2-iminopropanoate deaminase
MPERRTVSTPEAPAAVGPYSQAVRAGGWLFVSGMIALDPGTGVMAPGGVREQAETALENLGAVLRAAGLGYKDVVKTTVFLTDLSRFAEMNEVYSRRFPQDPPARSTVEVKALPKGALVEVEAIAYAGG